MFERHMRARLPLLDEEGAAGSGGGQGAVTPEQIAEIVNKAVREQVLPSLDAAITNRLGGREELRALRDLPQTVQGLIDAGKATIGSNGDDRNTDGGKRKIDPQVAEELDAHKRESEDLRKRLHIKDKNSALQNALSKAGILPESMQDGLELLISRPDIVSEIDSQGSESWSGKRKNELGDLVTAPIQEVVNEFLSTRPGWLPPRPQGGAGGVGRGPGGEVIKPLSELSAEDIGAMDDKALDRLWQQNGGQAERAKRGGFWS